MIGMTRRLSPQYAVTKESALGITCRSIETVIKPQPISDLMRLQLQTATARGRFIPH